MKTKIKKKTVIKIVVLAAVVAGAAIILRMSGDIRRATPYDASQVTSKKFEMMKRWLPRDADLILIADVHRLAEIPSLKAFLEEGLFKGSDTAIRTIKSLLGPETAIGMLSMSAILGDTGVPVSFFVVVQGEFREVNFVEAIKKELAAENVELESKIVNDISIYKQKGADTPFAFAVPDRNHLVVGTSQSMEQIFEKSAAVEKPLPFPGTDSPFFGYLRSSDRIKKVLPPQFASLEIARFWAGEDKWLHVTIECSDAQQAQNLRMFLSGMKALYALQKDTDKTFVDAITSILMGGQDNVVNVDVPLEQLPVIFTK